jgi:DNA-directed RNA polymerase
MQHVAALIRDFDLASLTNLTRSNDNDCPEDFYTDVIKRVNVVINEFGRNNLEYYNLALVALNRVLAKNSIMTVIYNVSVYGMKEQFAKKTKIDINENNTIEDIIEKRSLSIFKDLDKNFRTNKKRLYLYEFPSINENETVILNAKDVFMISKILNDFIFNEYKGLGRVYLFLTEIAKITNMLNLSIKWKAPNGLEFTQHYLNYQKSYTKIRLFGVVREMHHLFYFNELNKSKQKNAVIPNIIHTLDASHAYSIIMEANKSGGGDVISIHDCFGCHPNRMSDIHHIVRKTFVLQYTNFDFLNDFRELLINHIKLNNYEIVEKINQTILIYDNKEYVIPNTPKLGEFDIKQIEGSSYIIS